MKKMYLLAVLMAAAMPLTSMAQDDDLYFNPKKEAKEKLRSGHASSSSMLRSVHLEIASTHSIGVEAGVMWMSIIVADASSVILSMWAPIRWATTSSSFMWARG